MTWHWTWDSWVGSYCTNTELGGQGFPKWTSKRLECPGGLLWTHTKPWRPHGFSYWSLSLRIHAGSPLSNTEHGMQHWCAVTSTSLGGPWGFTLSSHGAREANAYSQWCRMEPGRPMWLHSTSALSLGGPCRFTVTRPWAWEENSGSQWPGEGLVVRRLPDRQVRKRVTDRLQRWQTSGFCYPPYLRGSWAFIFFSPLTATVPLLALWSRLIQMCSRPVMNMYKLAWSLGPLEVSCLTLLI